MKKIITGTIIICLFVACGNIDKNADNSRFETDNDVTYDLVLASEVEWTFLNPARGDKAPMAGTLWGDRKGTEPTGFLLKPKNGFQSPPHIHNVSYRGVVISGFIHNDDPEAENMWMSTGSFWTQPKGDVHITSAKGNNTMAYIEIEEGPYLVHQAEDAFHTEERPVNVDKSNIVWLDASDLKWLKQNEERDSAQISEISFLWGKTDGDNLNGTLIKIPGGFKGKIQTSGKSYRAVVIQGQPLYRNNNQNNNQRLETGSYFGSIGKAMHLISNESNIDCILYVRSEGKYHVLSGQ